MPRYGYGAPGWSELVPEQKKTGFLFVDGFADWEYGPLAASAGEWFGARAVSLTPEGKPVTGISGFRLIPDRSASVEENADLDAVAVIGSDHWAGKAPPDVAELLNTVAKRGGVVGGICAGTLALARAGMFEEARHTSNGRDSINGHEARYAGDGNYQDVPHAVADGRAGDLAQLRTLFVREYAEAPDSMLSGGACNDGIMRVAGRKDDR